ncbi:MAG: HD domain-containing protein [Erysipelotrichaceae bacterium]|nr:HD domain-containing protein [Erysipelotrichaceae bacterium]
MKYTDIKNDLEVVAMIKKADANLNCLGYTDHSFGHVCLVAERAAYILKELGYSEEDQELVKIAAYMHDIGNLINRKAHAEYGGLLANEILKRYDISIEDRLRVVSAISNHDESSGGAIDHISAALIIADKTDVRRNRVKQKPKAAFDIHDRVNYAVTSSELEIDNEKKRIILKLEIDEDITSMYEYFDIFLGRMMMSKKASELLEMKFKLIVNDNKVL